MLAATASAFCAAPPVQPMLPFSEEHLKYTVNWDSGLSLGEGRLDAKRTADFWQFDFSLNASVPGFAIHDSYTSIANGQLCAVEFQKEITHGKRHTQEKTVFDYKKAKAKRSTKGGGESESPIPACARDVLSYFFFARHEFIEGRVPAAQSVWAGATYQVRLATMGPQPIKVGNKTEDADGLTVSVKGPGSDLSFEAYFARDKARTPLMIRCPFSLGVFTLELVR